MSKPKVRIWPSWYLWWSPTAWQCAKAQEAMLNWWLENEDGHKKIADALWTTPG